MGKTYAVVEKHVGDDVGCAWYYDTRDHYGIYDRMMDVTGGDHEESANAASWCELADVGETYEFREGEIRIEEG